MLNPMDSTFWNNRAMAKAKLEEHGAAIADASESNFCYKVLARRGGPELTSRQGYRNQPGLRQGLLSQRYLIPRHPAPYRRRSRL